MRILIRQGEGPAAAYARAHSQHVDQERQIAQAILDTSHDMPTPATAPRTYGLGDARQLRGIPTVGVKGGLGGAIPGTRPGA